ncbi:MAG: glucose-6-phosphate isomerase, partial [Thermodesulfovibrionales bacterium]|nr:glucose-6-phosphate isomerase [Thermodesulfovibrionales bacterium]
MLELNFSNMMGEVIGEKGVSERQIEGIKAVVYEIDKRIKAKERPELAFIDLLEQDTSEIKNIASDVRKKFENFLILGIGGSALGPRAILEALSPFHNLDKKPRVFVYDNVDPRTLQRILSLAGLKKTAVNVITKSGSTAETIASFMILWDKMNSAVSDSSKNFIATTDPEKGSLRKIADEKGFRTLSIPQGAVGRYSVLSPVGLLCAEVAGVDSSEMLKGARDIHSRCSDAEIWKNPAYLFGTLLYLMEREEKRNINVLIPYADGLKPTAEWFCQLWAESLGKSGSGLTPYPSLGTTDQHSQLQLWMEGPEDKVVVFIKVDDYGVDFEIPKVFQDAEGTSYLGGHTLSELIKAEQESTELALSKIKRPNMTISIPKIDAYHMGQLFHFFEMATAFTGFLYGVNSFNQPGVEEGKNFTYGMMGRKGYEAKRDEVEKARAKK